MSSMSWNSPANLKPRTFTCGFCGKVVASDRGYFAQSVDVSPAFQWLTYICPHCYKPTFLETGNTQIPGVAPGVDIAGVPTDVDQLYREARNSVAIGSYTAAVLTCRKILMNIAVSEGASAGESFQAYVEFLSAKGFVPPHGKGWVDHIRTKGNEANHQIVLMSRSDAEDLITFLEMLLKFIFEFPSRVPKGPSAP